MLCAVQNETDPEDFNMHGATIKTTTYCSSILLVLRFEDQSCANTHCCVAQTGYSNYQLFVT